MAIGDSFIVRERHQHARVAASEYARRHGMVFTCRMQEDRTMVVHRVTNDQRPIDQRGRNGRRRIVAPSSDPNAVSFEQWLQSLTPGMSVTIRSNYRHLFSAMQAWVELHALKTGRNVTSLLHGGELLIKFS